uniref:Uncharacterized protein n=1 Tax=Anguilla anguilla TaxID=7936 RepID=A0A0E9WD36_ANGAN
MPDNAHWVYFKTTKGKRKRLRFLSHYGTGLLI